MRRWGGSGSYALRLKQGRAGCKAALAGVTPAAARSHLWAFASERVQIQWRGQGPAVRSRQKPQAAPASIADKGDGQKSVGKAHKRQPFENFHVVFR